MKTTISLRTATMIGGILILTLATGCSDGGGGGYWNHPYGYNNGYNGGYNGSYSSYGSSYPYSGYDNSYSYPQNYGRNSYNNSYSNGYQNGVRADENRDRHQANNTVVVRERNEARGAQHSNADNDKYSRKDDKHSEKN
jgi:hypothetical protein